MMKPLILIALLTLSGLSGLYAQNFLPATLSMTDGSEKRGWVYYGNWNNTPRRIRFKDADGKESRFGPHQIKRFSIERKDGSTEVYIGRSLMFNHSPHELGNLELGPFPRMEHDTVFLHLLLSSDISLYELTWEEGKHFFYERDSIVELIYKRYYSEGSTGQYMAPSNNQYRRQLLILFYDYPSLHADIQKMPYTQPAMMKLFKQVSQLKNTSTTYTYAKERTKVRFTVLAGSYISATHMGGFDPQYGLAIHTDSLRFPLSIQPALGLGISIPLPHTNQRMSFYNDLTYRRIVTHTDQLYKGFNQPPSTTPIYSLHVSHLRLFTGARWLSSNRSPALLVQAGVTNGLLVSDKSQQSARNGEPYPLWGGDVKAYEFAYGGGIGAMFGRIGVQARYDRGGGMSKFRRLALNFENFSFLLNWQF